MRSVHAEVTGFVMDPIEWRGLIAFILSCLLALAPVSVVHAQERVNYSNADLAGQNLAGRNYESGSFVSANLQRVNLAGSNLKGSTFTKANLAGANLQGVDLGAAMLDLANLAGVNFKNANLTGIIASRADWTKADITGADFTEAILDRSAVNLLCQSASGTNPQTGVETRESLGCR